MWLPQLVPRTELARHAPIQRECSIGVVLRNSRGPINFCNKCFGRRSWLCKSACPNSVTILLTLSVGIWGNFSGRCPCAVERRCISLWLGGIRKLSRRGRNSLRHFFAWRTNPSTCNFRVDASIRLPCDRNDPFAQKCQEIPSLASSIRRCFVGIGLAENCRASERRIGSHLSALQTMAIRPGS